MVQVEAIAASQRQLLQKPTCAWIRWVQNHLLLLLVLLAQPVLGGQIVKYLPGFDGELPFKLETGYISVDDSELFYYFIESEGNPQEDPLFLWLTGGPGCTSLSGLLYEVGPMEYDIDNYTGGLPKLKYYPYARTKTASMIFLDAPVGTGFSYARTPGGWPTSDTKSAEQSYQFLRKWLVEHPQFLSVQLFVGGDSYAGLTVPLITKKIIDGNKEKAEPYMNIKGYLVGCPGTDSVIDGNSRIDFAHRMTLISDEIYENAKRSCNENYINVDPANTACITAMGAIQKCLKDLSDKDILKPKCDLSSQDHPEGPDRRFLKEGSLEFLLSPSTFPKPWCTTLKLTHNSIWANDDGVQEALHVRKGTVPRWERCNNSLSYTKDVSSVIAVHKELSRSSLEVLVESPPNKKPPMKSSSNHSKVDDSSDTLPKTFSRKKRTEVVKEKSSTPKKPALKEKSSTPKKPASMEKSGKKAAKGKDKPKEDKLRPSDDELRNAICEILKEVDFNTATFTDILKQLAGRFKMDLTPRKSSIKLMIQAELTKLADEADDEEDEGEAEKDETQPGKGVEA